MPVENLYVDLRILDKPASFRRLSLEELRREGRLHEDDHHFGLLVRASLFPTNTVAFVKQRPRLFVLGPPGAGKTTLLKHLGFEATARRLDKVPVLISLRELSDSASDMESYVVAQFAASNFPDPQDFVSEIMRNGEALVMFDGLDEVNEADGRRSAITRSVLTYIEKYHQSHFVITSRIGAVDNSFQAFTFVEIARFSQDQIEKFASKWFGVRQELSSQFIGELVHNENLLELAQTPLLLTLLCLTFEEMKTFPHNRAELYKEAFEILLRKWDDTRRIRRDHLYGGLSYERRRQLLMTIAYQTLAAGELFFTTETISRRIAQFIVRLPEISEPSVTIDDGESILRAIEAQHGVLSERAVGIYAFSHKTFLEFFAARYIVESGRRDALVSLPKNMFDRQWREVILLTSGLIGDADELIFGMIKQLSVRIALAERASQLSLSAMRKAKTIRTRHPLIGVWTFYLRMFLDREMAATPDDNVRLKDSQEQLISATEDLARIGNFKGLMRLFVGRMSARAGDDDIALDIALEGCVRVSAGEVYSSRSVTTHFADAKGLASALNEEITTTLESIVVGPDLPLEGMEFSNALERVGAVYRGLQLRWNLSAEDYECLAQHVQGLGLILECLELAPISDRGAVLSELLSSSLG